MNSRSSIPRSLVRVWWSRACRESASSTRGAGGRHPCEPESAEGSESVKCCHCRQTGPSSLTLPGVVQFDEAGLLEQRYRRHHRFTHESRERRGTGFFGRLPGACRPEDRSFDVGDRSRDGYLRVGSFQAGALGRAPGAGSVRGSGLGGWLGLHEPGQRELLVLILVLLAVSLGAELAPAPQSLEEGKLLPAEKTLHTSLDRHVGPDAKEGT